MDFLDLLQIVVYFLVLLLCIKPLGHYMAQIYTGETFAYLGFLRSIENGIYRLCMTSPLETMDWKAYLRALLVFNLLGFIAVYLIQRFQFYLPLNVENFANVSPTIAFNTAASFVSNTNWQAYSGERSLSYFTQMSALTVQNFLSAATGMAVLIAFIRGLVGSEGKSLGNFWVDMTRSVLYILLPLSLIFALILSSTGVIQNLKPYLKIQPLEATTAEQILPMGPVASQVAIKQLGTNGGGFFNTNSAHPFENPSPVSNFLETLAILLIPAALCYSFGILLKDKRQARMLLVTMFSIFIPIMLAIIAFEYYLPPMITEMGIDPAQGNMEGKETRFGVINSGLWAAATTATSSGSVNAMHDSFMPMSGFFLLVLMQLGEVVFGGVGSGLYGMLLLIIATVFIAGLMVGRTPEYLGKKIEPYEMKMVSIAILIMPIFVLLFTAIAALTVAGTSAIFNPGAHGLSEMLYAFTSMINNNGSAFAGINAATPFYTLLGGIGILIGRYGVIIAILAIAGSLVGKKIIPPSAGTLPTHNLFFIILLIGVIVIFCALTFLPVLALGPIVEHLLLWGHHGH